MALVILIVAAIGVTAAFLYRSGELSLLPEGTPEGTVHRFLLAIEQGDSRRAYDYLNPPLQQTCTYEHFRDTIRWFEAKGDRDAGGLRVTLEGTHPIDGTVEVRVRIIRFHFSRPSPLAPPFDPGESSYGERFTLEMTGGEWLFIEPPWPMTSCPDSKEKTSPAEPPNPAPG
ncbi:MAG: hypothetical protein BZY88_02200 [SAR202 cluster bacterium Io17-Chloro-G9]|nr:MAG: hypothetical protein BZY88_02200 [SAR202 cluster bacterium Io17-Chloro-G9]